MVASPGALGLDLEKAQGLGAQLVEQQPSGDIGVVGLLFNQGARRHHQCGGHAISADAVIEVGQAFLDDAIGVYVQKAGAGLGGQGVDAADVQRCPVAIRPDHLDVAALPAVRSTLATFALPALLGPRFAVDDVGARHLVLPGAHQRQFNLILDVLDVQRGPGGETALEYAANLGGQRGH